MQHRGLNSLVALVFAVVSATVGYADGGFSTEIKVVGSIAGVDAAPVGVPFSVAASITSSRDDGGDNNVSVSWSFDLGGCVLVSGALKGEGKTPVSPSLKAKGMSAGEETITLRAASRGYKDEVSCTVKIVEVVDIELTDPSAHKIGSVLTKDDFTIVTYPSGYPEFVSIPPTTVKIGLNKVTATCGTSEAHEEFHGVRASGEWTGFTRGEGYQDDSNHFYALSEGLSGKYEVRGKNIEITGGDIEGPLSEGETFHGTVTIPCVGAGGDPTTTTWNRCGVFRGGRLAYGLGGVLDSDEIRKVDASGGAIAGIVVTVLVFVVGIVVGIIRDKAKREIRDVPPVKTPPLDKQKAGILTKDTDMWDIHSVKADVSMTVDGLARIVDKKYDHTMNATASLTVTDLTAKKIVLDEKEDFNVYSDSTLSGDMNCKSGWVNGDSDAWDVAKGKSQTRKVDGDGSLCAQREKENGEWEAAPGWSSDSVNYLGEWGVE